MSYENVKNSRQRLKSRAVYAMGGKCQCCGYNKCLSALEFHHLNENEKEFSISTNSNRSWALVSQELPKCALLCANCHREVHAGLINGNLLKSPFSKKLAEEVANTIKELKTKQVKDCEKCGKIIDYGAKLCKQCFDFERRRVERPSREELKSLIRNFAFTVIAKDYGVTDNAVRKWCDFYNLPRRKKDIKTYSDEEWENI